MLSVEIIGNIGRNAEPVVMSDGREKMRFSVCVDTQADKSIWCGVLAPMSSKLMPYLVKGKQVFVRGGLKVDIYNGGIELSIFSDRIELCGGAKTNEGVAESAPVENAKETAESDTF